MNTIFPMFPVQISNYIQIFAFVNCLAKSWEGREWNGNGGGGGGGGGMPSFQVFRIELLH